jgi:HAD superfamily hydrolase (TIGR01662 family)
MNEVVMILGAPASGKSTYSNLYIKRDYVYLNRDKVGGKVSDLLPKLNGALAAGSKVVLDNLFTTKQSRKEFIDLCLKYNVPIKCVWVSTSIEDCQINLLFRMHKKYKQIFMHPEDIKSHSEAKKDPNVYPPVVLFKYKKEFEPPTESEGFSEIEIIPFVREYDSKFKNKALILDYDDTLRISKGEKQYPIKTSEIEILPNRRDKILEYKNNGYLILGVSNQSGVHKNIFTLEDAHACFQHTNKLLDLEIDYQFCPHQSTPPVCFCRKPQSGNGVKLITKYMLNPKECIFVGDATTDKTFAKRIGFQYYHPDDFFKV